MITARLTENNFLQIVAQSDKATSDIECIQVRFSRSEMKDLISCLEETVRRLEWIGMNYHTDKDARDTYNHALIVREGSFVTVSYMSVSKTHMLCRSSTILLCLEDLEPLISSLKAL